MILIVQLVFVLSNIFFGRKVTLCIDYQNWGGTSYNQWQPWESCSGCSLYANSRQMSVVRTVRTQDKQPELERLSQRLSKNRAMSSTLLMTPTQTVGSTDGYISTMQNSEISLESDSWGVAGRIPEFKATCSMAQLHHRLWTGSWHCLSMHWTSLKYNNIEYLASSLSFEPWGVFWRSIELWFNGFGWIWWALLPFSQFLIGREESSQWTLFLEHPWLAGIAPLCFSAIRFTAGRGHPAWFEGRRFLRLLQYTMLYCYMYSKFTIYSHDIDMQRLPFLILFRMVYVMKH